MSTVIRIDQPLGLADTVRVYAADRVPDARMLLDVQHTSLDGRGTEREKVLSRGVVALTSDEATDLVRAVIREGGISSDIERVRIAYLLLAGLGDEFAEVTDTARARLSVVLTKVAEGEF